MMTMQHNVKHVEPAKGVTLCVAGTGRVALHPFLGQAEQAGGYRAGVSSMPLETEPSIGRIKGWLGHDMIVVSDLTAFLA